MELIIFQLRRQAKRSIKLKGLNLYFVVCAEAELFTMSKTMLEEIWSNCNLQPCIAAAGKNLTIIFSYKTPARQKFMP